MNLIILQQNDFIDDECVSLHGRRYRHIHDILGATPGKTLQVGLLNGKTGTGVVQSISSDDVILRICLDREPPVPVPMTLILAMPRPKVFKRILQSVTAMGIKRIILLNSWRVDKSYWNSPLLKPEALREQCLLGLEQGRDTILPSIEIQQRFKPFVEDSLIGIIDSSLALLAHPQANRPCPANLNQAVTVAIGPEGGFTDYEVSKLEEAGMLGVHLGQRPMRVETAVPALLGRLVNYTV